MNAIASGWIATGIGRRGCVNLELSAVVTARLPLERPADRVDLAGGAPRLASPAGRLVDGVVIPVDVGHGATM